MKILYTKEFLRLLKKQHAMVRKSFKSVMFLFSENPHDPQLNNHSLKREWQGYRSIDITNDYRAIFTQRSEAGETVVYFVSVGIHAQLYG